MENFAYYRPTSAEQAVGLLDAKWGTAELLGGGTDLVSLQKQYIAQPKKVISLASLPDSYRQISGLRSLVCCFIYTLIVILKN